jgi:hypothetical protein
MRMCRWNGERICEPLAVKQIPCPQEFCGYFRQWRRAGGFGRRPAPLARWLAAIPCGCTRGVGAGLLFHRHAPRRAGQVRAAELKTVDLHAHGGELVDRSENVDNVTTETIELAHHEDIITFKTVEEAFEAFALTSGAGSGDELRDHATRFDCEPGASDRLHLIFSSLLGSRTAAVSKNSRHRHLLSHHSGLSTDIPDTPSFRFRRISPITARNADCSPAGRRYVPYLTLWYRRHQLWSAAMVAGLGFVRCAWTGPIASWLCAALYGRLRVTIVDRSRTSGVA